MTFFEFGSIALSEQTKTTIAQAAQVYKTRANAKITVTGYADTVGVPAANMQLSQRRADAVKAGLVAAGVPAAAIMTAASGETSLLVDTGPQAKEPRNRRVVISFN
jgi:outer membrane protein OmpA-like peptidoglycan-associated protein